MGTKLPFLITFGLLNYIHLYGLEISHTGYMGTYLEVGTYL